MKAKHVRLIWVPKISEVENPHDALPGPNFTMKCIKQMTFNGPDTSSMHVNGKDAVVPGITAAVTFIAGKGFVAAGFRTGCEFYLVGDKLYRRLTWVDVGVKGKECGFKVHRNNHLVYYVVEVPMTDDIERAIGEEL